MSWYHIAGIVLAVALALYTVISWLRTPKKLKLTGSHAFITGGSLGIGKAIAMELAQRGCHVTIVARNESSLSEAVAAIEKVKKSADQKIHALKADVTSYPSIREAVNKAQLHSGPIDLLIANAGLSIPNYFVEAAVSEFETQMKVNYLGVVHTIKAAVPTMMSRRSGHIVIVSSPVGFSGFVGYSGYAPTKFAQRGLAESLANEFCGYNIGVSLLYPSDTNTPGFETENKTKPHETKVLSTVGALQSAESVARAAVDGIVRRRFHIATDTISLLSIVANYGFAPRPWPLLESLVLPVVNLVQQVFVWYFNSVARGVAKRNLQINH